MSDRPTPTGREGGMSYAGIAKYRISSFIKSFTILLYVGMGMAVVGLVMKYAAVTGGSFVFVFAMAVLSLLFLVQIGLSFFYVIANIRLALLGAFCSVSLVAGFLALIFRYQDWFGWQIMFFIALPMYLLSAIFLGTYLGRLEEQPKPHRRFLNRNLLVPYLFILVLGLTSFVVDADSFNREENDRLQQSPLENQVQDQDTTDLWRAY